MNRHSDEQLIDRHLAGILEPDEESRLEHLIRTSPAWAGRYREAEELTRLIREGIGTSRAPQSAKDRIHRLIADGEPELQVEPAMRSRWPRIALAAAAVVLLALGLTTLTPDDGAGLLPAVYADEVWPVKDLARSADVLLVGRTEDVGGTLRLRLERTVFGEIGKGAVELPPGVRPDQRVALFGRRASDTVVEVVGGLGGVIHLDGVQRWDGHDLTSDEVLRQLEQAATHRSLDSALGDLQRFLDSPDSRVGESGGLHFSAAITARYLGGFDAVRTRDALLALILAPAKHPTARNAGAEALVHADPVGACRTLLSRILSGPVERMHAETEDGLVLLGCLHLIQQSGAAELAGDLALLADRVHCAPLARAARAARLAVTGRGRRTPALQTDALPVRIDVDGREAIVMPGCEGRREGLVVVWMDGRDPSPYRLLASLAVERGLGVVLVPEGPVDVREVLAQSVDSIDASSPLFVGIGAAADAALAASRKLKAARVVLVDAPARAIADAPADTRIVSPLDEGWTHDLELLHHILSR